jgi:hypothetical protein
MTLKNKSVLKSKLQFQSNRKGLKMKKNVGNFDKAIRIILGLSLIGFAVISQNWWGLIGIIPLLTGIMNYCPIYGLIKVSTVQKVRTEKLEI